LAELKKRFDVGSILTLISLVPPVRVSILIPSPACTSALPVAPVAPILPSGPCGPSAPVAPVAPEPVAPVKP